MNLSNGQKVVAGIGAAVIVAILLYVPWEYNNHSAAGYSWLFSPPGRDYYTIDFKRLAVELAIAGIGVGVGLYVTRENRAR